MIWRASCGRSPDKEACLHRRDGHPGCKPLSSGRTADKPELPRKQQSPEHNRKDATEN